LYNGPKQRTAQLVCEDQSGHPGVDVMITIFFDFQQFFRKKLRFSQKPML
jgi:hypothetical protein